MNTKHANELFIQVKGIGFAALIDNENKTQPYQPCILGILQSWGETDVFTSYE